MILAPTDVPARAGTRLEPFAIGLVLLGAVLLRSIEPTNSDVSWLITLSEKVLDGARPYRDFFEVNPPASIGLYLPGVALARALGLRPEAVTDGLVFLACAVSLGLTAQILAPTRWLTPPLGLAAIAALLLLPANTFGEREHIVTIAILPCLAGLALRLSGKALPPRIAILSGLLAGVAVAIKPMFALALAGPLLLVWARVGWSCAWRVLDVWVAGLVATAYGAVVLWAFPDFTAKVLPIVMRDYVPARLDALSLIVTPGTLLMVLLGALWLQISLPAKPHPLSATLVLAAAGFAVSFWAQGKGWPYHAYPALALLMLAVVAALTARAAGKPRRLAAPLAILGFAAAVAFAWFDWHVDPQRDTPQLAAALRRIAPHPRLLAMTSDIAIGHPLVRDLGGRWVGTFPASWIHAKVALLRSVATPAEQIQFDADERFERATYAADIEREKPDAILVDGRAWNSTIAADAGLRDAFAAYRIDSTIGDLEIWRRALP